MVFWVRAYWVRIYQVRAYHVKAYLIRVSWVRVIGFIGSGWHKLNFEYYKPKLGTKPKASPVHMFNFKISWKKLSPKRTKPRGSDSKAYIKIVGTETESAMPNPLHTNYLSAGQPFFPRPYCVPSQVSESVSLSKGSSPLNVGSAHFFELME